MDTLIKLNEQLMNVPAGVLVGLFSIAFGYVLKWADFFPNKRIPLAVVCVSALLMPLLLFCVEKDAYLIPRNAVVGFVIGFIAWLFHAKLLKQWLDPLIPVLNKDDQNKNDTP